VLWCCRGALAEQAELTTCRLCRLAIACGLQRTLVPLKGNFVISDRYVGFFRKERLVPNIKYRFSISSVLLHSLAEYSGLGGDKLIALAFSFLATAFERLRRVPTTSEPTVLLFNRQVTPTSHSSSDRKLLVMRFVLLIQSTAFDTETDNTLGPSSDDEQRHHRHLSASPHLLRPSLSCQLTATLRYLLSSWIKLLHPPLHHALSSSTDSTDSTR
jgi:hypothetical protein